MKINNQQQICNVNNCRKAISFITSFRDCFISNKKTTLTIVIFCRFIVHDA